MTKLNIPYQEAINQAFKTCLHCFKEKPLSCFNKDTRREGQYRPKCKQCVSEYDKKPERLAKRRICTRIWRKNNAEYAKKKCYEWREKNPDGNARITRAWRERNPEQSLLTTQEYQSSHPEKVKQFRITRRQNIKKAGGTFTKAEWEYLKKQYNYHCLCCGKSEPEVVIETDHIIPVCLGGSNSIDNIQPLCHKCNSKKHVKIIDFRPKFYNVDNDYERDAK